jgi:hypothetical protein
MMVARSGTGILTGEFAVCDRPIYSDQSCSLQFFVQSATWITRFGASNFGQVGQLDTISDASDQLSIFDTMMLA